MTEAIIFIAIGFLLLLLLLVWVRRRAEAAPARDELSDVQETLAAFHLELPAPAIAEKIFSNDDWHFASGVGSLPIQRMFLTERTRIARFWLRQTKNSVDGLMNLRRLAVRHSRSLRPATEIKLAAQYVTFLGLYLALYCLIWLRGPFAARRIAAYGRNLAEQVLSMTARGLRELDSTAFAKVKAEWSGS